MILLPTKGRPNLLRRFFDCCNETKVTEKILLIFDGGESPAIYDHVGFPPYTEDLIVPAGTPLGGCFNAAFEKYPNEPYYGLVSDDCTPETPRWDVKLRDACLPDRIAWPAEGIHNEKLPGFVFIGGDLVRKLGWICHPAIKHWFTDHVWLDIVTGVGNGAYLPHVMLRHRHYANGLAPMDDTYKNQPDHAADQEAYRVFVETEMPALLERLRNDRPA